MISGSWPLSWDIRTLQIAETTSDTWGLHQAITKTWNEFSSSHEDIKNESKESIPNSEFTQTFYLRLYNVDNAGGIADIILLKIMRDKIKDVSSFLPL